MKFHSFYFQGNKASTEFNIPWAQLLLVQTAVLIRLQSRLLVTTSREYRHKCFPMMYNSGCLMRLFGNATGHGIRIRNYSINAGISIHDYGGLLNKDSTSPWEC
ncbi:hypothetical protein C4D60_Mb02t17930 [Musa balbisiana]|uniref:Uncharacterized protein n=1 Tax=Musa balbisiana TaxID=52838 RepID=A0A4S8IBH5_MUSBA|nr:hypothetical protein C4D60_Mb02t17930 [Musa balbisiana]